MQDNNDLTFFLIIIMLLIACAATNGSDRMDLRHSLFSSVQELKSK